MAHLELEGVAHIVLHRCVAAPPADLCVCTHINPQQASEPSDTKLM